MRGDYQEHERERFVSDLLGYMTLQEKLGQIDLFHPVGDPALEQAVAAGLVGGVLGATQPMRLQTLATDRSRLGIPLLLAGADPCCVLSPWALAAGWDEDLAHAAGAAAARDAIAAGYNCMQAPRTGPNTGGGRSTVHIASQDPYLSARLAAAFARGANGVRDDRRDAVLAIPACDPPPLAGGDAWSLDILGAGGVAALDCLALDDTSARRGGFSGILVSECQRIADAVARQFRVTSAPTTLEAAERLLAQGAVSEHELDAAVRGVLTAKHALGLFRDPQRVLVPQLPDTQYGRDDHRVRSTFVLLRNEAGLLPLSPVSDRVLVVGATDGAGSLCADALGRAGIAHSLAPGLAQRRPTESWDHPIAGDHFALSLTSDAARRADFVLVALDERHFTRGFGNEWRQPTAAITTMIDGLATAGKRLIAIVATTEPVDLADIDRHFAAVLQCWDPRTGTEEALSDVLSGRFSPQGRMPANAGRFLAGHGLGFGESVISGLVLKRTERQFEASVKVRNLGSFAMRETIQAYTRSDEGRLRLVGFAHVMLEPGDEASVALELRAEAIGVVTEDGRLDMRPGPLEILVGKNASRLLSAIIEITPAMTRAMMRRDPGPLRLAAS